jgi:hypothetical protein
MRRLYAGFDEHRIAGRLKGHASQRRNLELIGVGPLFCSVGKNRGKEQGQIAIFDASGNCELTPVFLNRRNLYSDPCFFLFSPCAAPAAILPDTGASSFSRGPRREKGPGKISTSIGKLPWPLFEQEFVF